MNDKKVEIFGTGLLSLASLILAFYFYGLHIACSCNEWWTFLSNLFLGLSASGVVALAVGYFLARSKFDDLVNKMLHVIKRITFHYEQVFYADKDVFLLLAQEITDEFDEFYTAYSQVSFIWSINWKYKKLLGDLFVHFVEFSKPFVGLTGKYKLQNMRDEEIDIYFAEAKSLSKIDYENLVLNYAELYFLWDKELFQSLVEGNHLTATALQRKKHPTLQEILHKNKNKQKRR